MTLGAIDGDGVITECTFHQLLQCLDDLGLSEQDQADAVIDVLSSGHVRVYGNLSEWFSRDATFRGWRH